MEYTEAAAYLLQVPKFTSKNRPENLRLLLAHLGNPQEQFAVIHVAGTNGKGSVCAFLDGILRAQGKRTGLFTSPHLIEMTERFRIQGQDVSRERFASCFVKVKEAVEELLRAEPDFCHPTFFEWLFAMAAVLFAEEKVDYGILETGLGGRLDATNVVEHPHLTVITSISLDHTEILGDTIGKIAREKAGIIKEGVPVICDGQCEEALQVIKEVAREHHAPVFPLMADMYEIFMNSDKVIDFSLDTGYYLYNDITVSSPAGYQAVNASLAVMAAEVLYRTENMEMDRQAMLEGIRKTRWPGRMEEILPDVFIDGGHNEAGIAAFTNTAEKFQKDRAITLLFSAVKEKNYTHMIQTICERIQFRTAIVTRVGGARAVAAKDLASVFGRYTDREVLYCEDVEEAFRLARAKQGDGMLFCAGSLYLAGEIRRLALQDGRQKEEGL